MKVSNLICAGLILFSSCQENNKLTNSICLYPSKIESLGLRKEYDETKWSLYLLHYNDTPKDNSNRYLSTPPVPYSGLGIGLDSVSTKGDTSYIYVFFIDRSGQKISNCIDEPMNIDLEVGRRFIRNNDSMICFLYKCTNIGEFWTGPVDPQKLKLAKDRKANPLQPDVIKFLNDNKKDLHPWLYREAVKRGVIKDSLYQH